MPEGTDRASGAGNAAWRNNSGPTTMPRSRDGTWGQDARLELRPHTSPCEWGMPEFSKWDWKGWVAVAPW
jgi:hypothetical protein